MRHIEILLPFALPPAELAPDLVRELSKHYSSIPQASACATLLARSTLTQAERMDAFTGALPHELWLKRRFGLNGAGTGLPLAAAAMRQYGIDAEPGWWFILNPVHIHVARDHLVLTSPRQLEVDDAEARSLFEAALPAFQEAGHSLLYGDAKTWFLRADGWQDLQTSTPDAATGHNIDIWMPTGADDSANPRRWRKLQNEVQMEWHAHPVNQAREMRGEKPVNSLWLWGGAALPLSMPQVPFSELLNLPAPLSALAALGPKSRAAGSFAELQAEPGPGANTHRLLLDSSLQELAMEGDWGNWLLSMQALEQRWLAPLLAALKEGALDRVSMVLSNNLSLKTFEAGRASLRKFWVKPSFSHLLP